VVLRLIQLGCSHTGVDKAGWTPLMWAAAGGHAGIIGELMARGADFRVRDERGRGPLHWASERGHVEAVDLLVEKYTKNSLDLHALVIPPPPLSLLAHPTVRPPPRSYSL